MTSLSQYAVAALLFSRIQKGEHVLVVGDGDREVIGLAVEICRQDDSGRLHAWQGWSSIHAGSWHGYAYTVDPPGRPEQEITCMGGADMDLVLILGDTVPPWGVYPYGCPVLRVNVDDRDE